MLTSDIDRIFMRSCRELAGGKAPEFALSDIDVSRNLICVNDTMLTDEGVVKTSGIDEEDAESGGADESVVATSGIDE